MWGWDSGRGTNLQAPQHISQCGYNLIHAAPGPLLPRSLCPGALPRVLWSEAFGQALYAGALAALEAGYAAVGLYLMRRLEEWTAETVRKPCGQGSTAAGAMSEWSL